MKKGKKVLNFKKREGLMAHVFLLPFYIGFLVFFVQPIYQSICFSFQSVTLNNGYYDTDFVKLENYSYIFLKDANYLTSLIDSLVQLLWQIPVIIVSSLFFAIILNQKFSGRAFVRSVFFIPVIIASGIVIDIINGDSVAGTLLAGNTVSGGEVSQSSALKDFLLNAGLHTKIVSAITTVTDKMFSTMWSTGIQTIIFLTGLQNISPALYEAAEVEGASAWENFWKITLPMLLPIIMINMVYTIVDSFTGTNNPVMKQVLNNMSMVRFGWASAMAWTYFAIIAIVLGIVMIILSKITRKSVGV